MHESLLLVAIPLPGVFLVVLFWWFAVVFCFLLCVLVFGLM